MPREMPDSSERTMQDPRESELLWLQTENQRLTSENEVLHQINDKLRHVTEQRLSRASGAPTHEQSLQPSRGRHELCGWRPTLRSHEGTHVSYKERNSEQGRNDHEPSTSSHRWSQRQEDAAGNQQNAWSGNYTHRYARSWQEDQAGSSNSWWEDEVDS
ncbi:unnamed protein product [Symbiodinium pilosum]|uniref:Uncharacterized protein n=1 Tax=Symbiodinium pilosum TaxID=2952 RepID=A0A812QAU3_SYMPI|nr:unnamed protein product [Symbiodinium pilosum]